MHLYSNIATRHYNVRIINLKYVAIDECINLHSYVYFNLHIIIITYVATSLIV